jgi:RecA-family ATPase
MSYDDGLEGLEMSEPDLKLTTLSALEAAALHLGTVARNGGLYESYRKEEIDHIIRMGLNGSSSLGNWNSAPKTNGQRNGSHDTACLRNEDSRTPLPFIDMSRWDEERAPRREWAVYDRIPLRQVTLLTGEGAVGKSILLMQLLVAASLGREWLDTMPEPGPALYLGAEDDADELHRRIGAIASHYGAKVSQFADLLHLMSFAGEDAVLGVSDRNGRIVPTTLFQQLKEAACDIRPRLIGIDTVSDVFAGEENDRAQVRQFIGMLRGIAISAGAAVVIVGHPSLTGIKTGTGLSGSTAWHNSVRGRAYFKIAATEKDETPDPGLRQLEFQKNQYGPLPNSILVRWRDGVFVTESGTGSLEKLAADQRADEVFITLLKQLEQQGRSVNDKPSSPTFAPKVFSEQPTANGMNKKALAGAMQRLFAANKIRICEYGRPSRPNSKLELVNS